MLTFSIVVIVSGFVLAVIGLANESEEWSKPTLGLGFVLTIVGGILCLLFSGGLETFKF